MLTKLVRYKFFDHRTDLDIARGGAHTLLDWLRMCNTRRYAMSLRVPAHAVRERARLVLDLLHNQHRLELVRGAALRSVPTPGRSRRFGDAERTFGCVRTTPAGSPAPPLLCAPQRARSAVLRLA